MAGEENFLKFAVMESTAKPSCNIVADLMVAHGIQVVIASPGSRNAPLVVALSRRPELKVLTVVDERQGAFNALGIALESRKPVALVCTSGTAVLNYLPAVAEAYYRAIPLVVVSADRPVEWIDQDDSQTLWQDRALEPYVKRAWSLDGEAVSPNRLWHVSRCINDLLMEAVSSRPGPVHLNLRLDAPLGSMADYTPDSACVIEAVKIRKELPEHVAQELADKLSSSKTLVIAGFMSPDEKLQAEIKQLLTHPNVAVVAESVANLNVPGVHHYIDTLLCNTEISHELQPQVVITLGGALISRKIKEYLRSLSSEVEHWAVGVSHTTVDCFQHLKLRIDMPEAPFFHSINKHWTDSQPSTYASVWQQAQVQARFRVTQFLDRFPWSDFKAMGMVFEAIPTDWNLQVSNGTAIRYAQLFLQGREGRCDGNRGVSGIDGSTSTAIGAGWASEGTTCLITGDMSCQYDVGALGSQLLTPRMKMVVLCNGGGGIFRFVNSTRTLPERERFFGAGPMNLPLKSLSAAYGWAYYEAQSAQELEKVLPEFISQAHRPALLGLHTPHDLSAQLLTQFLGER